MTAEAILAGVMLWTLLAVMLGFAIGRRLRTSADAGRRDDAPQRAQYRKPA
jgi:hypothetical protein